MAKVAKNLVLYGSSGKLGEQLVIRNHGGQIILAQAPGERTGEPTAAQAAHQTRFQQAVIYGKTQMADPVAKAAYEEKAEGMQTAFNMAVADFFNAPQIDEVDLTAYAGAVGDTIRVRVTDDFHVAQVHVAIYNADASLVEEGDAVLDANGIDWLYTVTAANADTAGDRIVVRASDQPGNLSEEELTM
jgi:hypothetical protein